MYIICIVDMLYLKGRDGFVCRPHFTLMLNPCLCALVWLQVESGGGGDILNTQGWLLWGDLFQPLVPSPMHSLPKLQEKADVE